MVEGVNSVVTYLGLGTRKIVPFCGITDLYQSKCLEFRYRDGKVLGT